MPFLKPGYKSDASEKRRKAMGEAFKDLGEAIDEKKEKKAKKKSKEGVDSLSKNKDTLKRITSRMGVA